MEMDTVYLYSMPHDRETPGVARPRGSVARPASPLDGIAALKGRGTAWAIEHRFTVHPHEAFDDGWGTLDQAVEEQTIGRETQVVEAHVKEIVSSNDSPDISFDLTINPYRGCEHGCIYCFA